MLWHKNIKFQEVFTSGKGRVGNRNIYNGEGYVECFISYKKYISCYYVQIMGGGYLDVYGIIFFFSVFLKHLIFNKQIQTSKNEKEHL